MAYNLPQTWVLLSTQTVSGVSTVEFKSLISSNYDVYKVLGLNFSVSNSGAILYLRFSTDNGSTYVSSNCSHFFYYHDTTATFGLAGNFPSQSQATIQTVISDVGLQSLETYFFNLNSSNIPLYSGSITHNDSLGGFNNAQHTGINSGTTPINALEIYPDSGTISGTFYFYGEKLN